MLYRKKPMVIEAIQYDENTDECRDKIVEFTNWEVRCISRDNSRELTLKTLEGFMHVSLGDYIIKGIKGEFYPCKQDIFLETYDKVEEDGEDGEDGED